MQINLSKASNWQKYDENGQCSHNCKTRNMFEDSINYAAVYRGPNIFRVFA